MRVPCPSEPNFIFPTYQVPQVSAMRGRAPPVQVARAAWGGRADPPSTPCASGAISVISSGSSCSKGNSNLRMQSVTENCLLNSVTVPKIQRNDQLVGHNNNNNSDKLECKFGALLLGQDIPNQKSDALELKQDLKSELNLMNNNTTITTTQYLDNENHYTLDRLIKLSQRTRDLERQGHCLPLRLRGGGESSISTGTTGWGTPPSQQASNNNSNNSSGWGTANPANQNNAGTQQWNNNSNRPPTTGQGPNNQDANKGNSNLPPPNGQQPATSQSNTGSWGPNNTKPSSAGPPTTGANTNTNPQTNNGNPPPQSNSTKQQLEQLTNMREAIYSQDGWGGQHVNQDTSWDIPGSPEPSIKLDPSGAPPWKPNVNNGTELWEANLRNGGQPPPQPQQKTPWGHTPSTNIGGTWGEDDDVTDTSNVWTGVPSGQQQWGNNTNNGAMWGGGGPKKDADWTTGGGGGGGGGQGGQGGGGGGGAGIGWGDPRSADPRAAAMDPRDMRPDPRDIRAGSTDPMRMMDPRDQMRLVSSDMRGDLRGITGRLNGAGAEFWGQAGPQAGAHHLHHQGKMPVGPGNSAGWEEPSPPSQRRNMPNYDDGTSLWGNPQQGQRLVGSHWKDLPTGANMGRGNSTGPPGMSQSRMKPDGSVWGHGRNGSWDEGGPPWDEGGQWPKQKAMGGPLWDNDIDWNHKQGPKQPLTKELVWNSKQFRALVEMGYKKEDVENALRIRDMNFDEALEMLGPLRNPNMESWRGRHEEPYDHQQFSGQRFSTGPSGQMSFPTANSAPNLLNNMNNASTGTNNIISNMSPALVQKMLSQGGGLQGFGGSSSASGRTIQPQSQPSSAQLRMLVQQIQMAVQAGYLNHQILNQPLAPQTLVLLNQLLQQIKNLQQLNNQQNVAQSQCIGSKPSNAFLQCSVLITKTKQHISNLQNQIAAQQAVYVKQQQHLSGGATGPSDLFKHESINAMQSNFADLVIKDTQVNQQQSRLNQWKLPAIDKDDGGEFSRAPGSVSKPLPPSHSSPNLNPLGLTQTDGPWSTGRSADTGWPDSGAGDSGASDLKDAQWPAPPAQPTFTDLVPEFEPGKPWKGTQTKSIEDDPSITPGSVVRSPLSIAAIKEPEMYINPSKSPPPDSIQPPSLSSSTWSYPPASTSCAFTSPQSKLPNAKGGLGGDLNPSTAVTSELWGAPKSRGPPPGLSAKSGSTVNGWSTNISSGTTSQWAPQRNNWGGSPWLLLRNLTAQIDGSTLRTLCMQHGPLHSFHLYLRQGFALTKYSTREEASKAQTTLNNCVLGNTTILAENPNEWEATNLLQQVASQQSSSSGAWISNGKQPSTGGDTWSTGWGNASTTSSLWGTSALDTSDQARATPSSLNSFLPGDLLGGESM